MFGPRLEQLEIYSISTIFHNIVTMDLLSTMDGFSSREIILVANNIWLIFLERLCSNISVAALHCSLQGRWILVEVRTLKGSGRVDERGKGVEQIAPLTMLFPCTVIAVAHQKYDYIHRIHAYLMLTLS